MDSTIPAPAVTVPALDNGEILLHTGLHKTGTTALQNSLAAARDELPDYGVRYPGKGTYQHNAVLAGANRPFGWRDNGAVEHPKKHWNRLLKQAKWDGRTIVSSEFLDDVRPEVGADVIEQLGGVDKVRVAVTLRAVGAILPSAWQQHVKSGMKITYNQWLKQILADEPTDRSTRFWWRHDQLQQVRRWADIVGPERTYAIVVPNDDRNFIFNAFEQLLGLPHDFLADRQGPGQNRSMTAAEAEMVRRLNKELVGAMNWQEFSSLVRRGVVLSMVERRTPGPDEEKVQTPKWAAQKAAELGRMFADGLPELGVNIIGDPEQLAVEPKSGRNRDIEEIQIDAAVAGLAGVVEEALKQRRKLSAQAELSAQNVPTAKKPSVFTRAGNKVRSWRSR